MLHEEAPDTPATRRALHEELHDLTAMWRVRLHREGDLDRADDLAVRERGEQHAPAALDVVGNVLECRTRLLVRERRQVADRRASGDAIFEHGREPVEMGARMRPRRGARISIGPAFAILSRSACASSRGSRSAT